MLPTLLKGFPTLLLDIENEKITTKLKLKLTLLGSLMFMVLIVTKKNPSLDLLWLSNQSYLTRENNASEFN